MTISVKFDHNWDAQLLEKWRTNQDDELFDEYSMNDLWEIYLFAEVLQEYSDIPLSVLEPVAELAVEEAIIKGFDEIAERWISHKTMWRDIADLQKKEQTEKTVI